MRGRLAIDLLGFTGERGGTETYTREILSRLPSLLPDAELVALANSAGAAEISTFFEGRVMTARSIGRTSIAWAAGELLLSERFARGTQADVLWTPANFGPVSRGVRRVATVHDLIYHQYPGHGHARLMRRLSASLMAGSARSADHILTISEATAQEITHRLSIPRHRISVIPNGASETGPMATVDELAARGIELDRPVVLSVSNRMPHKNLEGMLHALALIEPAERPRAVVTGGGADDPLRPLVQRLGLQSDVILPGWVSARELESLYAHANAYICPSMAEGFGLPIVEAMRRGCVVVANDIPVLREVGGDSPIYADAGSPRAFAAAIRRALDPQGSTERREAGRQWATRFTWAASAAATAEILGDQLQKARRANRRAHHRTRGDVR